VSVCQAVQHAHQKGVIHRDLKPSNVLVTLHDGVPVAKVIDFGIAKAVGQPLTERTLFTNFAQMVGTPLYMSPEQAQMSGLDVDTRADIYALGVLLYELLTGTTPFDREQFRTAGYDEIRRIIREQEPPRPSTRLSTLAKVATTISANRRTDPDGLRRQFRGELDWIVMKCLEKDRNRRYESAAGLAADVRRYLADEPVQACPPSTWYRFRKLARRNRRALVTVSALAVALLVGVSALAVGAVLVWRANRDLKESLDREQQDAYFHRIALAHRELSGGNIGRALEHLEKCPAGLRQWEWHYLMRLCKVEPVILRDATEVNSLAFSPHGEWIASAGEDGAVKVWDSKTGAVVQILEAAHTHSAYSVVFHSDGKHLASTGGDGKVKVWNWKRGGEPVFTRPSGADHNRGTAYGVAFSPDGRRLAAGCDGAVNVWDWENEQLLVGPLPGHAKKGICVAFSPDGQRLASGSWTGHVMIWDAETGELLHTLSEHHHPVSALAFSPDGRQLVSACFNRSLIVWDAKTGQPLRTIEKAADDALVLGVAFGRSDDLRFASVGEDKTVRVWEATTGREVLDLRGHTDSIGCVAYSRDGLRLASSSLDRTIRVWDATPLQATDAQEAFTFTEHTGEVWTVAVSPDGQRIASAGQGIDTPVKVWDVRSRQRIEFTGHQAVVFCVAWHPDGKRIASSGWDAERRVFVVKFWNARTREVDFEVAAGMETPALAFSPDGEYLVTGGANRIVQVWNARTGEWVGTLGSHDRQVQGLAFSGKGEHVASASADGAIELWDATRLGQEQTPRHILGARIGMGFRGMSFSPDGRRLVAGGEKTTVKIWDVKTGQELRTFHGHSRDVWATAFSPDPEGRWVASAGEDSTVRIWDSQTGKLVRSFRGHTGLVHSLAFTPDGKLLVSGSRDHTVKLWDMTPLKEAPNR
jgi:WD40 repeat protein